MHTRREHPLVSLARHDPVGLLRYVLERRQFRDALSIRLEGKPDRRRDVRFQEALEFVEVEPNRLRELVINFLAGIHSFGAPLVLWLHSDGKRYRIQYGLAEPDERTRQPFLTTRLLRQSLLGNFLGIRLSSVSEIDGVVKPEQIERRKSCAIITGIPSEREETPVETRLDEAFEGLSGIPFDLVIQCRPVPATDLDLAEANMAWLSDLANRLARQQISETESVTFSESVSSGISRGLSVTDTENWSTAHSESESSQVKGHKSPIIASGIGTAVGAVIGGAIGAFASGPASVAAGAKVGAVAGAFVGRGIGALVATPVTETKGTTETEGRSVSEQVTETLTRSQAETKAEQIGRQVSYEAVNGQAEMLKNIADKHLRRFQRGRSVGLWQTSVQIATDSDEDTAVVAHILQGALRGDDTYLEPLSMIRYDHRSVDNGLAAISHFIPPEISAAPHPFVPGGEQPATLLTSDELAHWFRPPSQDVAGIPVRRSVHFSRALPDSGKEPYIELGNLIYWGRKVPHGTLRLPIKDLSSHVFVAGATGSGKTTTIRHILAGLSSQEQPIPFLLVEPAKSEYRDFFDSLKYEGKRPLRLRLGSPESNDEQPLHFNPFVAPVGVPLGRHVEAMKILLGSCFTMQESLPQVLEQLIVETYHDCGWDSFLDVVPPDLGNRRFPSFDDFFALVEKPRLVPSLKSTQDNAVSRVKRTVAGLGYEPHVARNFTAAMTVRLQSFMRGIKGEVFQKDDLDFPSLLTRPCFLEVSDITEPGIRRFLLGAFFLRLYSEREAQRRRGDLQMHAGLHHLVVLEEAHHFLRHPTAGMTGFDLMHQSNLIMADAFAELRAFGQGILVADQAPAELSPAIIRSTNTKLMHRLFHEADCNAIGEAAGLEPDQILELRRLRPGECVAFGLSFPRAVCCKVPEPAMGKSK